MFRPLLRSLHRKSAVASIVPAFFSTVTAAVPEKITVLKLNNLQDNPGAVKKKKRVGRGMGSGRGKTCGRGQKGKRARQGGSVPLHFEGGQTPFWKRVPKRGFTNGRFRQDFVGINIGSILNHIIMGRLNSDEPITLRSLQNAGMFKASAIKHGVKLLSSGKERLAKTPIALNLHVSRASSGAIAAVEAAGGSVTSYHYNTLALRTVLRPEKYTDATRPKHARPPPKLQPYYTNWNKRGYLNPAVQMRQWFDKQDDETLEKQFDEFINKFTEEEDDQIEEVEGEKKKAKDEY